MKKNFVKKIVVATLAAILTVTSVTYSPVNPATGITVTSATPNPYPEPPCDEPVLD